MDYTAMEQYWIWLSSVEGIGAKRFYQLLSLYEDARSVWDALGGILAPPDIREALGPATFEKLRAARDECYFYRLFDRLERGGIKAVTRLSEAYPPALTGIYDPPPTLYVRGDCPLDGARMLAIVGSRHCTRDGQRAAREFAREVETVQGSIAAFLEKNNRVHATPALETAYKQAWRQKKQEEAQTPPT